MGLNPFKRAGTGGGGRSASLRTAFLLGHSTSTEEPNSRHGWRWATHGRRLGSDYHRDCAYRKRECLSRRDWDCNPAQYGGNYVTGYGLGDGCELSRRTTGAKGRLTPRCRFATI